MSAQQWLISHDFAEIPEDEVLDELRDISPQAGVEVNRLVSLARSLGVKQCEGADREDFVEHTMRVSAALDVLGRDRLWLEIAGGTMRRIGRDGMAPLDLSLPRIGAMFSQSHCRFGNVGGMYGTIGGDSFQIPSACGAETYFDSETFAAENRRGAIVSDGSEESLMEAVRDAAARSEDRSVWMKSRASKASIMRVSVPESDDFEFSSLRDVNDPWVSPLDLLLAHEGQPRSVLVAPHVEILSEYRVFLVAGTPITGAGNIEQFTPLDRDPGTIFDPKVEGLRGDGHISRRPDLMDAYVRRATEIGARLEAEGRGTCALDLALIDGRIGIVELNALGNAGLYASDPYRLYLEVAARPDLFTPIHP